MIWGGGGVFLFIFSFAGVLFSAFRLKREIKLRNPAVSLNKSELIDSREDHLRLRAELSGSPVCLPWTMILWRTDFSWKGYRRFSLSFFIKNGAGEGETLPAGRGRYEGVSSLEVADIFSLVRFSLPVSNSINLFVRPGAGRFRNVKPNARSGGTEKRLPRGSITGEDFFDTRKYLPGDDVKRIHWKVYAHTGELFMRIQERLPPPAAKCLILLDPLPPPARTTEGLLLASDVMAKNALSLSLLLFDKGYKVSILVPRKAVLETGESAGPDQGLYLEAGSLEDRGATEERFSRILSTLEPEGEESLPNLSAVKGAVFCFRFAGAPLLNRRASDLGGSSPGLSFFLCTPDSSQNMERPGTPAGLSALFFYGISKDMGFGKRKKGEAENWSADAAPDLSGFAGDVYVL